MPLQEEFPGITGLVNLGSNFVENTNRVLEGAGQIQSGKDSTQVNEEARPIGSEAVLNGKPVFWAGQNYGYQTKESYDKLMDEGQFRMGEITAQRIGNSISQAIPQEAKDFATEKITDAATAAENFYNQQDYDTQQNIKTGLRFAYGAVTTIDKGLEFISEKTNTSRFITDELVTAAATGGASVALKRAAPIVKQAGKTAVNFIDTAIDDILTPPGGGLQLATAGSAPMGLTPSASNGSISLRPQVLKSASDFKPTEWQTTVKQLRKENTPAPVIDKVLKKDYHSTLEGTRYEYMSRKDLSENKGGWLDMITEKADQYSKGHENYTNLLKIGKKNRAESLQRKINDDYTDSPLNSYAQMYAPKNPIRTAVQKAFNSLSGQEWHHIFGSKDGGELLLTKVAQDPYIAVNLIHHLKRLKINSSGAPQNMALMKPGPHRGKGDSWHNYAKEIGFDNVGKKKGILNIADFAEEMSKEIVAGRLEVTELFNFLEVYAKVEKSHIIPKLKKDYGAKLVSEEPGVMQFIQGVKQKNPKQTLL